MGMLNLHSLLNTFPTRGQGNNRMIRYQKYVEPALREMRPQVTHRVLSAMRKEKFEGDKEAWKKAFSERIKPVVSPLRLLSLRPLLTRSSSNRTSVHCVPNTNANSYLP